MIKNYSTGVVLSSTDNAETSLVPAWQTRSPQGDFVGAAIDMGQIYNLDDYAALEAEIAEIGGVAPGAAATVTGYLGFGSIPNYTPAQVKSACIQPIFSLVNLGANGLQLNCTPLTYMTGRYAYVFFDHSALAAGCKLRITARLNCKR